MIANRLSRPVAKGHGARSHGLRGRGCKTVVEVERMKQLTLANGG